MNKLPMEIVNIILEYQGYHTFRYGKYMTALHLTEEHIHLLMNIPAINKNSYGTYEVCFWKTVYTNKTNPTVKNSIFQYAPFIQKDCSMTHCIVKKYICFILHTIVLHSSVLWIMNIEKYYDSNTRYDERDRTQFTLHQ